MNRHILSGSRANRDRRDAAYERVVKAPPRYCIRVTSPSGDETLLRHGSVVGYGRVVVFRNKRDAEVNLDFILQGMNEGTAASIIKYRTGLENED